MKKTKTAGVFLVLCCLLAPCYGFQKKGAGKVRGKMSLAKMIKRFAPTEVTADISHLSHGDRKALDKIIEAARYMDAIFLRQVWSGNAAMEKKLEADKTPLALERLHYFRINAGPWSRLDEDKPFISGAPEVKPPAAAFYPPDMTKDEFENWVKTLPVPEQEEARSYFTVIRSGAGHKLEAVPYSEEYKQFLEPAAKCLREAAALTTNDTLRSFLEKRAAAFLSNDYYDSDVAWMDIDAPIDVTIGPYETYEDGLFGYKASYEAFVTLRDEAESAKLARFTKFLQEIEDNLPEDPKYRNPRLGGGAAIRVVDEVFASGDGNRGVQTAAYNLPNDERVVEKKGTKRVMLKNVQEAKFNKTLIPISKIVLSPADQKNLSFDAFFTHILAHELMHGLGPQNIVVDGRNTTVRLELKETYSAIEEAKADITALFALQYMMDHKMVDKGLERTLYTTYLASAFRSVRFGISEAHGKAVALQFNYLTDKGAINYDASTGHYSINKSKIKDAVRDLTHDLLTVEAEGSHDGAQQMLEKYGVIRPEMQKSLDKLSGVPVDIEPIYPLAAHVPGPRK